MQHAFNTSTLKLLSSDESHSCQNDELSSEVRDWLRDNPAVLSIHEMGELRVIAFKDFDTKAGFIEKFFPYDCEPEGYYRTQIFHDDDHDYTDTWMAVCKEKLDLLAIRHKMKKFPNENPYQDGDHKVELWFATYAEQHRFAQLSKSGSLDEDTVLKLSEKTYNLSDDLKDLGFSN